MARWSRQGTLVNFASVFPSFKEGEHWDIEEVVRKLGQVEICRI